MTQLSHPIINLDTISKSYSMGQQDVLALKDISLKIYKADFVAITGSSGSGKTTLMNILGCLDAAWSGDYYLSGENVSLKTENELALVRNKKIGFIFQNFNLLTKLNALQNTMQPLLYRGVGLRERKIAATNALTHVGLKDRLLHLPSELSGGQRQRIAIARAIITSPSILLADEPTGNLDTKTTHEIMKIFQELNKLGHTIIVVTHEEEIAELCKRRIVLSDGVIISDVTKTSASEVHA
ncbi:ABC transporter ATP-binding protein [Alteromonas gilva]|uniref:ABC transporter ATP-binding protein n=1 Tax=Alteromonas gilva TaxID=2987522 RepID=A0ABT5L773_9ALTE|nr:ABC transporter ATP-binding protein [Alteromonas gilva]MDC8832900.1 ABC transporter ATP-binding protein [Alteromonas gilva]